MARGTSGFTVGHGSVTSEPESGADVNAFGGGALIAPDTPGPNFTVFLNLFCSCGWLMTQNDDTVWCENPVCPNRTTMFVVAVKCKPIAEAMA